MNIFVFDEIEEKAQQRSWVHDLDPRAKILVTVAFLVTMASFENHAVSALIPLALLPLSWCVCGEIPLRWILRKIALPVGCLGFFGFANIWFDRSPILELWGCALTTGFVSWLSIVLRAFFSVIMVLLLVSTTGMERLAQGLAALKVPAFFVGLILLLFRYTFVLREESSRMNRARACRSFGKQGMSFAVAGHMLGALMLRSLARAERIHAALLARGFGEGSNPHISLRWTVTESFVVVGCVFFLMCARLEDLCGMVGSLLLRIVS